MKAAGYSKIVIPMFSSRRCTRSVSSRRTSFVFR